MDAKRPTDRPIDRESFPFILDRSVVVVVVVVDDYEKRTDGVMGRKANGRGE